MWRKRVSLALLTILTLSILSGVLTPVDAWNPTTLVASSGGSPTIDGTKDSIIWSSTDVNVSYGEIGTRDISLFVMYEGSFLYILVELKFELAAISEETVSLFISNNTDAEDSDYNDKKQISGLFFVPPKD